MALHQLSTPPFVLTTGICVFSGALTLCNIQFAQPHYLKLPRPLIARDWFSLSEYQFGTGLLACFSAHDLTEWTCNALVTGAVVPPMAKALGSWPVLGAYVGAGLLGTLQYRLQTNYLSPPPNGTMYDRNIFSAASCSGLAAASLYGLCFNKGGAHHYVEFPSFRTGIKSGWVAAPYLLYAAWQEHHQYWHRGDSDSNTPKYRQVGVVGGVMTGLLFAWRFGKQKRLLK
eukprot:TRINITY_DN2912_c0_g1_i1.p1 TRINITY_DN2912_c0_g1~~TRINITY_DN2912_c0_g1_i1.p1  ORF type:complete len:243 (-),score=34.19 TRINITY_DN2912_c0_g1_i1:150-836(-)